MNTAPESCPKFDKCSAPICPLDEHWRERKHLDGEPVCLWLRELAKPGGEAILGGALRGEQAQAIGRAAPGIIARWRTVRRELQRASRYGSKVANAQRLKGAACVA